MSALASPVQSFAAPTTMGPTLATNLATNLNPLGLASQTSPMVGAGCCPNCGHKLASAPPTLMLAGSIAPPPARLDLLSRLSDAQRRVLYHLLAGLTEPQIAAKVSRSRHTVHDHTKAIYAALGVQRRVQLVHLFMGTDPLAILPPEDRAEVANASFAEPRDISTPPGAVPITDAIRREALRVG